MLKIGDEVVRTKGDYVVGRIGIVIDVNLKDKRAKIDWYGETKTWVSFGSLALKSIPYKIIPASYDKQGRRKRYQKYVAI